MGDIAPNHRPSPGTKGNSRSTTPRCRFPRWPSTLTARQKSARRWRASSGPPRVSPSASMTALTAPADAPEMPSIPIRPSSSSWSSTPQVKAPWAPPPCSARLIGLARPLLARAGGWGRRRGARGVSALETRFASRMGNILECRCRGRLGGRYWHNVGTVLLHCNIKLWRCSKRQKNPKRVRSVHVEIQNLPSPPPSAPPPLPPPPPPAPDHDRGSSDAMPVAGALCGQRAQRLTPIRRKVLAALLASHKPLGAYEIIDRLALKGPRPAPITAYRALEFLRENGLVHRI